MVAALGPHNKAAHRLADPCPPAAEPTPRELLAELVALDAQLAQAVKLLNSPTKMQNILTPARAGQQDSRQDGEAGH